MEYSLLSCLCFYDLNTFHLSKLRYSLLKYMFQGKTKDSHVWVDMEQKPQVRMERREYVESFSKSHKLKVKTWHQNSKPELCRRKYCLGTILFFWQDVGQRVLALFICFTKEQSDLSCHLDYPYKYSINQKKLGSSQGLHKIKYSTNAIFFLLLLEPLRRI